MKYYKRLKTNAENEKHARVKCEGEAKPNVERVNPWLNENLRRFSSDYHTDTKHFVFEIRVEFNWMIPEHILKYRHLNYFELNGLK